MLLEETGYRVTHLCPLAEEIIDENHHCVGGIAIIVELVSGITMHTVHAAALQGKPPLKRGAFQERLHSALLSDKGKKRDI